MYHVKRSLPWMKAFRTKHNDHLLYLKWQEDIAAAKAEHEQLCEQLRWEVEQRNRVAKRDYDRNLVREFCNRGVLPTVNFKCWKSGSKTTLAAHFGSIVTELARNNTILVPSTASTSSGASGTVTGLKGEFLTMTKFARILGRVTTTRELARELPKTRHGLSVIIEDSDTDFYVEPFDTRQFRPVLLRTHQLTDGCVIEDDGNDDIKDGTIPVTAARAADVIVLVASNTQPHSHGKMEQTLGMLKKDSYRGEINRDQPHLPGELRSTASKIENAIIVISGVKPDDEVYDFEKLRGRDVHDIGESSLPEWNGQGYTIPWDPYVFGGHNVQNVVDLTKINQATYDAYLEVTLAILREGARALGIDLTGIAEFQPEQFVAPPEPDIPEPTYASNAAA